MLWAGKSLETRGSCSDEADQEPMFRVNTRLTPVVFVPPLRLASTVVSCSPSNSPGSQLVPSREPSLQKFKRPGWLHLMHSQYLGI